MRKPIKSKIKLIRGDKKKIAEKLADKGITIDIVKHVFLGRLVNVDHKILVMTEAKKIIANRKRKLEKLKAL